jgi:plasmid maintenance system antidote protein VapI
MYLKALNLSKKTLAAHFEMRDSNLHKYLSGERKLNAQLALKPSTFSHTKPDQWLRDELKNEMIQLKKKNLQILKCIKSTITEFIRSSIKFVVKYIKALYYEVFFMINI